MRTNARARPLHIEAMARLMRDGDPSFSRRFEHEGIELAAVLTTILVGPTVHLQALSIYAPPPTAALDKEMADEIAETIIPGCFSIPVFIEIPGFKTRKYGRKDMLP